MEQNTVVQIYCDRCNRLIFPQETVIGASPVKGYNNMANPVHIAPADGTVVLPGSPQGTVVDNYLIMRQIGVGGMGTVYLADHVLTHEKVVIKALNMDFEDESQRTMVLEYFIREAQILKELNHPNIVKFKGCGNFKGRPYLAMEFIEGDDLKKVLMNTGAMKLSQAIFIMFHLASALEYAYNLKSETGKRLEHIHRDIKPSNIILAENENLIPKLIDFGLAKSLGDYQQVTIKGATLGTPNYMPKEQILNAQDADHRSDIYSLGATFYHMLAGRAPFEEFSHIGSLGIMEAIVNHKLTPLSKYRPNLPPIIYDIVDKTMANSREERYQFAMYLKRDLKAFIESLKK